MKQLELNIKKRLLIVETDSIEEAENEILIHKKFPEDKCKLICKGSELTEEVAGEIVIKIPGCKMSYYIHDNEASNITSKALESFISSIEAQGYYWGENPVSLDREKVYRDMGDEFKADGILRAWRQAELKMFYPEKTLIFEII